MSRHETYVVAQGQQLGEDAADELTVIAAGKIGAPDGAGKEHVAHEGEPLVGREVDHVPRRVAGDVEDFQGVFSDGYRVALFEPAIGQEGFDLAETEGTRLLRQRLQPETFFFLRPEDGYATQAPGKFRAPAAWSMCPCVSRIWRTFRLRVRIASSMRSRSPPGSMTAASPVRSHHSSEQFCSKGVTGMTRTWSMASIRGKGCRYCSSEAPHAAPG